MFGSNSSTFGAFGQNSNNNQSTSGNNAFSSFGTPATSQGTSFFGQPQQQQTQQQSGNGTGPNPFAGFGSTTSQSTPSFGGFNSNAQQGATGFGFGGAVTATPAFGSSTGGLFNQSSSTSNTPAFGSQPVSSGLFGNTTTTTTPATSTFGAPGVNGGSGLFGASSTPLSAPNGTANPPFSVFSEKEGTGTGTNHFQSITCMPAYSTSSFEELRVQDYQQNRRYGNAQSATGFGNSGPFNATPQGNSLFGGNAPAQASSFGSAPTSSMFGQKSTPTGGMFGQAQNSNAFGTNGGMFGSGNASQVTASAPASNAFGTSASNTGGLFGANNSSTNLSANTGFSQNSNMFGSQPQNTSGIFGGSNANTNNNFGLNSSSSQKPFTFGGASTTPFGQSNTAQSTGGMFGSTPTTMTNTSTSNGLFGQNNQIAQSSSNNSNLFGNSTQTPPASTNNFSFGGGPNANPPNSIAQPATTSFNFGSGSVNSSTQKPFSFGTSAPTTNTFGGNTNNNANSKPFSFGTSNGTSNNTSGGLFGQNNNASVSGTPSLFGGQNSSLFGSANGAPASNSNTNTGLFGKPTTNSLFGQGSASTSGPGLFGSVGQNNASSTSAGNNLFGSSQAQSGNNLFTQTMDNRAANNLQSSLASNAYGSNPLFASVQGYNSGMSPMNSPTATPLVTNSVKKKPAMLPQFRLAPRSPANGGNLPYSKSAATYGPSSSKSAHKTSFTVFDEDLLINPDAFSPRTNIKRLVIDRKANDLNLLSGGLDMKGAQNGPPNKITGLNGLEHRNKAKTQSDVQSSISHEELSDRRGTTPSGSSGPGHKSSGSPQVADEKSSKPTTSAETDGDYWTVPALSKLLDYSKAELSRVSDFKIGRRGYGQVSFSVPVDLSSLEQVEDVAGKIVVFDDKMCTVYPDESLKPSFGKGLNQPATVTLEKCYPLSRDKREPIRDTEHPRFQQHVNRLKRMAETDFVDYLADSGTWIFKVNHF